MPLISIIIATYNCSATLQQAIDSIIAQTYKNIELIVIDGGSTDGTVALIEKNSEHIRFWISEPDKGIYSAWNKGLAQSSGSWICFLGADDYFLDGQVVAQEVEHLRHLSTDIQVAYSRIMLVDGAGKHLRLIGEPWEKIGARFRDFMLIPHVGAMHRRELFLKHGNFDESFKIAGDYELLLRELKIGKAYFIPGLVTVAMSQGGISSDGSNALLVMQEIRRAQRMHGKLLPGWTWINATLKIYLRITLLWLLGENLTKQVLDSVRAKN